MPIGGINAEHFAADLVNAARKGWLNRADGDGQDAALFGLDNPEIGREFDQRRGFINAHLKREPLGIGEGAAALILDGRG